MDDIPMRRVTLQRAGSPPVRLRLPDTHSPAFEAEARRQSRLAADAPDAKEIMDFLGPVGTWGDADRGA